MKKISMYFMMSIFVCGIASYNIYSNEGSSELGKRKAYYKEHKNISNRIDIINRQWQRVLESADIKKVNQLIQSGADVDYLVHDETTPLHFVASMPNLVDTQYENYVQIFKLLLDSGVNVNALSNGCTPMYDAANNGYYLMVKHLLEHWADLSIGSNNSNKPLYAAVSNRHYEIAELLLNYCLNNGDDDSIQIQDEFGLTLFHIAINNNDKKMVILLLEYAKNMRLLDDLTNDSIINLQDEDNYTPLYQAVVNGNKDIVEILLVYGANPNIADEKRFTPLYKAVDNRYYDIVKLLLGYYLHSGQYVIFNTDNEDGFTLLHVAVKNNDEKMLQMLLDYTEMMKKINVLNNLTYDEFINKEDPNRETALYKAVVNGNKNIVELLLVYGADPDLEDMFGFTPLHKAVQAENADIVLSLLLYGADTNRFDFDIENSPLQLAAQQDLRDIAQLLIVPGEVVLNEKAFKQHEKIADKAADEKKYKQYKKFENQVVAYKTDKLHKNIYGQTALDLAISDEMRDILS